MVAIRQDVQRLKPAVLAARWRVAARAMRTHRARAARVALAIVELCASFVFFWAVAHHVASFDFKPLAAFCVPIVILFYGVSSLLFNRGKSLAKGRAQIRSLYAAERAAQATTLYLLGILLGTSLYGMLVYFGVEFSPQEPTPAGLWLLLFIGPYAFMQAGFLCFMRALWIVAPQFLGGASAFELRRRVQQ
jgi:hypothetical protein